MTSNQIITPSLVGIEYGPESIRAVHAQYTGSILNRNEELRKQSDDRWSKADPDIKEVAHVPRVVWLLWQQLGITEDENELKKALERNFEYKTTEKRLI